MKNNTFINIKCQAPQHPTVYFLSGCQAGTTFEYRVLQKQEQLAAGGIHSLARQDLSNHEQLFREATAHDVLYLYRIAYSPLIASLIARAVEQNIPVIFDTDDLVFEPDLVHHVDPVKTMNPADALLYYEGVWRYRRTLLASDVVVTSTEYLAEKARTLGKRAFVHRNGLSQWMLTEATHLVKQRLAQSPHDKVILGYGSGTATHRKDLAEIAEALAKIMLRHPDVELHIVGALHINDPLPLPDELEAFANRIQYRPAVAWHDWLALQHSFDINLAPLETANPFCDAKSEIKYTEAAVVGVPTVASRTRAFEFAIHDGATGFLAGNTDEWIAKLEELVNDATLRRRMGAAARADVLARYAPEVLGEQLVETLTTIQTFHEQARELSTTPSTDKIPLILNWIFPEPIPGSGGYTDIVRMMNLLASLGHQVNAYVVPRQQLWDMSELEIRDFIQCHFNDLDGGVFKWNGGLMHASDAVIATHWTTAYMADDVKNASKKFYFVQDWEPFFFPMGTQYLRAEQTYKLGLSCITLGSWLTKRMRDWYNADADYFDLAVDHSIYYPRPIDKPEHPRICFYARPSTPRRLFPIGMEALNLIHQQQSDIEIILYGIRHIELQRHHVPFPHTNLGILNERELAELFSSVDVGIVLSSTNCFLIPPEMMACKCAVVDLNRETVQGILEHEGNALLAEPTPKAIADTVLRLLEDDTLRQQLVETAYQQVHERSWEKSARRVEEILYEKLPAKRRARSQHRFNVLSNQPSFVNLPPQQQEHLNAVYAQRTRTNVLWRAKAMGWIKHVLRANEGTTLNRKPVQVLGELTGPRQIGQSFVARHDNLHRIDVFVATYRRRNTRDVILHLRESPTAKQDLATVKVNANLWPDNAYASFTFEPQAESRGKSYYFYLESPNSVPGDAITLWAYSQVNLPSDSLYRNGQVSEGQLIFGLFYQEENQGEIGERPLLRGWGRFTTPWDRAEKIYQLLSSRNGPRLWKEVTNYLKWKFSGE